MYNRQDMFLKFAKDKYGNVGYAAYHAIDWAANKTREEITAEIKRLDERYYKGYQWNSVENAQLTIDRINTLEKILIEII